MEKRIGYVVEYYVYDETFGRYRHEVIYFGENHDTAHEIARDQAARKLMDVVIKEVYVYKGSVIP